MAASPTDEYRTARDQLLALRTDRARAIAEFRFPDVGERWNWAIDWFDAFARGNERPGLVIVEADGSETSYTFDALAAHSDQVAAFLRSQGIGRGDSVLLMLNNQVELWVAMLAVIKLGAVLMPTATAAGPADLADRIERGEARAVICNDADAGKFDTIAGDYVRICTTARDGWVPFATAFQTPAEPAQHPGTAPDDRLLLYFTSGTTSRPKLVEHTQVSYPVGMMSTMYWLGLEPGDVHLNVSSPGWGKHAWSSFFAPWIAEATVLVYNYARFDAAAFLAQLRERHVTTLCAPPTVWRMLIKADLGARPSSLRELVGAGEPLNPEVIAQVKNAWGLEIRDGYGMTETTAQLGNPPGTPVRAGSMGMPLPGVPSVLVDPETGLVVEGVGEGEICLDLSRHPLALMTGYVGDAERTAQAFAGGFFHSGDIAARDADGYVTYVGRTDDVFKASDYKISPFEVESVLLECPIVAESAVVPAPDAERQAVPKAYVTLAGAAVPDPAAAEQVLRYAREHLAPWTRVRRVEFVDELPKTISGKIRRAELRARERERAAAGERGPEFRDTDFPGLRQ
ncbi:MULTISPECIES: AMP-binding protein [Microbacterium]|uniref:AMP-binding protein n=1 Tax=Microbacterium TaxID=33882 RepID=UPI001E58C042|nr:AMP-binding protein [Microbacterium nymphoidis]MCD2498923.1 AMP-binding protein [Microbacterium nymphoidis]